MRSWYAVYTHPREEHVAEENLLRQGFATYWPRYRKRARHARKVQDVPSSLFPRYLFTQFDAGQSGWRAIQSTRGIVGLVRQGLEPIPVPDQLVAEIRAREDEEGFVVLGRQMDLHQGQRIALQGEAFKGLDVVFETKRDDERVIAFLELFGRQHRVELSSRQILPATQAPGRMQ
jgi:transcriptional antiterminator RfaH